MVPMWKISGRLGNQMFQFAYIYSQMKDGKIPDCFVQDSKYFEKYEKELQVIFGENIGFREEVGLHIRRGDYVSNSFYVDLTKTDYYKKAIEQFPPQTKFLVVSDDISFAKEYLSELDREFTYAEGTDVEDLNTLASCSSQIIANSSFSWWAAFLNTNVNKTVIYPAQWFTDGVTRVGFPKTWLKL